MPPDLQSTRKRVAFNHYAALVREIAFRDVVGVECEWPAEVPRPEYLPARPDETHLAVARQALRDAWAAEPDTNEAGEMFAHPDDDTPQPWGYVCGANDCEALIAFIDHTYREQARDLAVATLRSLRGVKQ